MMTKKTVFRILLGAAVPLLIPLIGSRLSSEWKWGPGDFGFAWLLFASAGFAYKFAPRKTGGNA